MLLFLFTLLLSNASTLFCLWFLWSEKCSQCIQRCKTKLSTEGVQTFLPRYHWKENVRHAVPWEKGIFSLFFPHLIEITRNSLKYLLLSFTWKRNSAAPPPPISGHMNFLGSVLFAAPNVLIPHLQITYWYITCCYVENSVKTIYLLSTGGEEVHFLILQEQMISIFSIQFRLQTELLLLHRISI